MMTDENVEKIKEIKSNLKVASDYLKELGESAESSYDLWLSLNKETADETEITAQKVDMLAKKLSYHKEIVEHTKNAYLEIKEIAGEFSAEAISAESLYLQTVRKYTDILTLRNNAINSANAQEEKRVAQINKQIDRENIENIGISMSQGDLNSFGKVNEIINNFNKFLNDHKETFLEVGGTYEDLLELAKKQTGYDKVEEAYFKGKTGDVSLLKPYETPRLIGTLADSEINLPEFNEQKIKDAYKNNFMSLGEEIVEALDENVGSQFYETGVNGLLKMLDGMRNETQNNDGAFQSLGQAIADKLGQAVIKNIKTENIINNYNNNYNFEGGENGDYRSFTDWERYEQLRKLRGTDDDQN